MSPSNPSAAASGGPEEFRLPDVGEGLTEAEIVSWKVRVGDVVKVNDVVVEIETAKSLVELPSPYAGTVAALLVAEGETVAVGTPIIRIGDAAPEPTAPEPESDPPNRTLVGYGPREAAVGRRPRRADGSAPAAAGGEVVPLRALAKPPVRKLARDLGVDLAALTPTGPAGTVSRADVEAAATPVPVESVAPVERDEWREPVKGVRRAMASAMVASAFSVPHVTEWVTVDVSATTALLARLRRRPELAGVRLSPLVVVARACCLALRRTPALNAWWDDDAQEVVFRRAVNLGIAAATPRGLVVPNVRGADTLSLPELATALADLTTTAREGRTQPAQTSGGTFTITNVGPFGVDGGTPIINPGESAILCLGAVARRPWVVTDPDGAESLEIRDVVTLSLSFDHRHVDGATGSRFLADVAGILHDPASALFF